MGNVHYADNGWQVRFHHSLGPCAGDSVLGAQVVNRWAREEAGSLEIKFLWKRQPKINLKSVAGILGLGHGCAQLCARFAKRSSS